MSARGVSLVDLTLRIARRPPDLEIGDAANPYLRRWYVVPRTPGCNVYLHHICQDDHDRALHDHPWWNISFLLRGKYIEVTPSGRKLRRPGIPIARRATSSHCVELIGDRPVWTLFVTGPVVREWGFHCPAGWRHWKEFVVVTENGNRRGRGCE